VALTQEAGMTRFVVFVLIFGLLAGCNTMHGIGKDIEEGGEAIQRGAKKK
jgi:predicted small secreted protein